MLEGADDVQTNRNHKNVFDHKKASDKSSEETVFLLFDNMSNPVNDAEACAF